MWRRRSRSRRARRSPPRPITDATGATGATVLQPVATSGASHLSHPSHRCLYSGLMRRWSWVPAAVGILVVGAIAVCRDTAAERKSEAVAAEFLRTLCTMSAAGTFQSEVRESGFMVTLAESRDSLPAGDPTRADVRRRDRSLRSRRLRGGRATGRGRDSGGRRTVTAARPRRTTTPGEHRARSSHLASRRSR